MRQHIQVLLAALVVLIGGYSAYSLVFRSDPSGDFKVLQVQGTAFRTDAVGQKAAATAGLELTQHDTVSTGKDGQILLGIGPGTRLALDSESSIQVLEIDKSGVRVELENGRVSVRVRPGSPALGIANRGRAVNAVDADFEIAVDGEGAVGIQPTRGHVVLQGFEGVSTLETGQQLGGVPGKEPVLAPISDALLLEVDWPEDTLTRAKELTLAGRTAPFASVKVGQADRWEQVRAGPDGRFRARVELSEGENAVTVQARDVMGREQDAALDVRRDSKAPQVQRSEVLWEP